MDAINRFFLSKYEFENFTIRNKARALLYFNFLMLFLLACLIVSYSIINPKEIITVSGGAGSIIVFVVLSIFMLSKGKLDLSVMIYLVPTILVVIAARFGKLAIAPYMGFTSFLYYNFYIIVFVAVFGKKTSVPATTLIFIIFNIIYYVLVKDQLNPESLRISSAGVANSTAALLVTGVVSYINIVLTNLSNNKHKEEAETTRSQYEFIARVFDSIKSVASNLQLSVGTFRATAGNLTDSAQNQASRIEESSASMVEIAAAIDKVSSDAAVQTESLNEIQQSIEALDTLISRVAHKADEIKNGSKKAITQGEEAVAIFEQVQEGIQRIYSSAEKIREMVNLITEIADRTNLLSLNASIESARAGEAGKGFAVVAEEISKLADNSTASAKEISVLINETTESIKNGYGMFNELYSHIRDMNITLESSSRLSAELDTTAKQQTVLSNGVKESIHSINSLSQSISLAMKEQSESTQEISKSFDVINEITQANAATSEEVSGATESLVENAEQLLDIMHTKNEK
ncbi:MAG TPA: methyl-accepting chemotaxis protein [Spirochaetota bacterium]|nr:methyl-accepting chemotaxis protein [Spirochaetota bacterium]HPI88023.1 methyl-accepting chemotaxis protein [Spirochaetota bacterium]HPR46733.1 methyl-accepting chemotaxis protein [Spirochaetota bacterium]